MEPAACGRARPGVCTKCNLYMADRGRRPEAPPPHCSVGVQTRPPKPEPVFGRTFVDMLLVKSFSSLVGRLRERDRIERASRDLQSLDAGPRHIRVVERCTPN